jgi:hypothetical protein
LPGIADLNHPKFKVNVAAMQTNILIFEVDPNQVNANEFCQKLDKVSFYKSQIQCIANNMQHN